MSNPRTDADYMRLALALGARGMGQCWPNPAVGCVIVAKGHIIGRGWTAPGGRPHAETRALAQAGAGAKGATAYVTLEPCAHHGQTPPCTDALIAAGIARVVTALDDPDPRVAGAGHGALTQAGLAVATGCCGEMAARDLRGYLLRQREGRPLLTLKLAMSLDGRIATASGESQWITGAAARRDGHALRARHDGVLIGAGTARADDPLLTVRGFGDRRQPVRIVAARRLDLPLDGQLAKSAREVPLWLLHGAQADPGLVSAWSGLGAQCLLVPGNAATGLNAAAMLRILGDQGLTRVLCEGGGQLAASLLSAGLVDEWFTYSAGLALGADGRAGIAALRTGRLDQAPRFKLLSGRAIGGDMCQHWERV